MSLLQAKVRLPASFARMQARAKKVNFSESHVERAHIFAQRAPRGVEGELFKETGEPGSWLLRTGGADLIPPAAKAILLLLFSPSKSPRAFGCGNWLGWTFEGAPHC